MERIEIRTFRQALEHKHEIACFCPGCRRWASCDLAGLVAAGLGGRPIAGCRPRCRKCGGRGDWQVRPPMPKFTGATWMQTPLA